MPENHIDLSIIMPALNSEKTIELALASVRKQKFDQDALEILVIDGGSADRTRKIAGEYGCRVLENPEIQQEYAKNTGMLNAKGRYAMFLDSDEVLASSEALRKRLQVFQRYPEVKVVLTGGRQRPAGTSLINGYINTYSDPFSFFMYGWYQDRRYSVKSLLSRNYTVCYAENESAAVIGFKKGGVQPLVDICSGNTIDLEYFKSRFQSVFGDAAIIPKVFYMIMNDGRKAAILKNDWIIHYSSNSFKNYLSKLKWRVIANIHYPNIPGTGFSNRQVFEPRLFRLKKYLFIPYALTLIIPLLTSAFHAAARRSFILIIHMPLSVYTALLILYFYFLKMLGVKPGLNSYGSGEKKLKL